MELAKIAYESYRAHTGGISLASGGPIPPWEQLKAEIQEAWVASIRGVITHVRKDPDVIRRWLGQ